MAYKVFPRSVAIKFGSSKKMSWDTKIKRSGSNKIRTLTSYLYPRWTISVTAINLTDEEARELEGFFASLRGAHRPFLWYDHEDHHEENIRIGTGNGSDKLFYLVRSLGGYQEPVTDIVEDSLVVKVNGTPTTVTVQSNGGILFTNPPAQGAVITATFDYYWRVCLSKDEFTIEAKYHNYNVSKSFTLEVVR